MISVPKIGNSLLEFQYKNNLSFSSSYKNPGSQAPTFKESVAISHSSLVGFLLFHIGKVGSCVDPTTYIYTISAGGNKIATLVADSIDANLDNIFDGSIAKLSSIDAQLSDYGLINVLYGKYLNRAPDADGLKSWLNAYDSGVAITEIGQNFIRSQEYVNQFTSSSDFLKSLYHDSLGRSIDGGGLQHWSDALQSGITRTEVVGNFLASPEFLSLIGQP